MADVPLRLRVLMAMTDCLKQITVANGYHVDVGENWFRGRVIFGENDPMPMGCILEVPIPLDQVPPPVDSVNSSGQWELMIQGFIADDENNPTDPAHYFMADVKKRLVQEKRRANDFEPGQGIFGMGNHVTGLRIGPGVVRPPDEISATAYFWLTITLDMVEDLSDPYED